LWKTFSSFFFFNWSNNVSFEHFFNNANFQKVFFLYLIFFLTGTHFKIFFLPRTELHKQWRSVFWYEWKAKSPGVLSCETTFLVILFW
jgi:hypothetical protein